MSGRASEAFPDFLALRVKNVVIDSGPLTCEVLGTRAQTFLNEFHLYLHPSGDWAKMSFVWFAKA
jgi:hypothetical protein